MKMSKRPNPYGPEVEPEADGSPAIPLWIGGHAFLTMPDAGFFDIRDGEGRVLRRVPLCGADAVDAAVTAASAAAATPWLAEDWLAIRAEIGALAGRYAQHLEGLLHSENGDGFDARAELLPLTEGPAGSAAVTERCAPQIVALVGLASEPLAGLASAALDLLAAGHAVILKPSVKTPSAVLAFAELATRAGLPGGRLNVVHGDEAVVQALCAHPGISRVVCIGTGETAERIRAMLAAAVRPGGASGD